MIWLTLTLLACSGSPEAPAPPVPPAAPPPEDAPAPPAGKAPAVAPEAPAAPAPVPEVDAAATAALSEAVAGHMRHHVGNASDAATALLAGDLEAARPALRWLAEHAPPDPWPEAVRPAMVAMQQAAARAAEAEDARAAARAFGAVPQACGTCHAALGGPTYPPTGLTDLDEANTAHMARHQWAMERLWEGLTAPDPGTWAVGRSVLTDEHGIRGLDHHPELLPLGEALHRTARQATDTPDGNVYGELLATCGACHAGAGVTFAGSSDDGAGAD